MTGKNGTAIWTGLTAGTYVLEEVDPADGYSIIQSSETVYLADSGEQSVITVRFENMPDGILLIRKVCATNPSVTLPDAEFKITYADGILIGDSNGIFRTDENGEIRIEGLAPGKSVIVTEVSAPPGYIIDTQSQTVQIKEGRTVSLTFKNQPKGELIIQKPRWDWTASLATVRSPRTGCLSPTAMVRSISPTWLREHTSFRRSGARPDMSWIRRPPMWSSGPMGIPRRWSSPIPRRGPSSSTSGIL